MPVRAIRIPRSLHLPSHHRGDLGILRCFPLNALNMNKLMTEMLYRADHLILRGDPAIVSANRDTHTSLSNGTVGIRPALPDVR